MKCPQPGKNFRLTAQFIKRTGSSIFRPAEGRNIKVPDIITDQPAGKKFGRFDGEDEFTTRESNRLLRLPMYYNLAKDDLLHVVDAIFEFYGVSR